MEISAPVDSHLEVAEIHRRVIGRQGPALLFTNVKGSATATAGSLTGKRRFLLATAADGELLEVEAAGEEAWAGFGASKVDDFELFPTEVLNPGLG